MSDTDTDSASDDNDIAYSCEQDIKGAVPTRYMSKSQRRHVRRNLCEIGEAYMNEAKLRKDVYVTKVPQPLNYKPRPRKPGPWRLVGILHLDCKNHGNGRYALQVGGMGTDNVTKLACNG